MINGERDNEIKYACKGCLQDWSTECELVCLCHVQFFKVLLIAEIYFATFPTSEYN